MGKNKRGKGRGKHGMRPPVPHPAAERWPRPPPGGFRGPAPVRPMGPSGQRFPMPQHDFGPQSRMMVNNMEDGRRFIDDEPLHAMNFQNRPGFFPFENRGDPHFHHHPEFNDRPAPQRFYPPECGPRYLPPDFDDRPPDFYSPEFRGRPDFPMMNPEYEQMECYRPREPIYMPPMDAHGNHAFRERGGFAGPPQDFLGPSPGQGPGPVPPQPQTFSAPSMPPPRKPCPPQPQKKKEPAKPEENKTVPSPTVTAKISTLKNFKANTPRGRSLGIITFIGNSCGFIERDDLKKFSFAFNAFYGIQAHLVPGVKVHFTVVKNLGKEVATDVKVAPGGTEDIDSALYEGVVVTKLSNDTKEAYSGRVRAIISVDPIKLPFGQTDSSATLLLYDRVEFQLMTNVLTKEQRATNIKPKLPDTFQLTKEIRVKGVIVEKGNETLTIKTERHDDLTASATDRLSEDELNVKDEVEFTVMTVKDKKKAIRLKKLPSATVTVNHDKGSKNISEENAAGASPAKDKWKPVTSEAGSQESVISSEKHEGTILKTASKNSPTPEKEMDKQEPALGLLVTEVETKKLSFRSADVITKATMMVGDKVQFNISTNSVSKEESAVNLVILPKTFQSNLEEQRKIGHVIKLNDHSGFIKTQQDPQLFFHTSEVMEETKLALFEKVEYTKAENEEAAGGSQAVRIRRLNENIFPSASKLEAVGVKEKLQKKMTIKLLPESKDKIKDVKTEENDSTAAVKPNTATDKGPPSMTLMVELKKECEIEQEKAKTKDDREQSRDRDTSRRRRSSSRSKESERRRRSRSRSKESERRKRSRSRSRSRDKFGKMYRSSSRERRDSRYRRSRSRERSDRYRRSRSRSRERSSRSARKRSYSPDYRDDRSKKHSSSKDSSNKTRAKSPEENVDDEISKKRKELMELNEMIARKKAIVAMAQNAKRFEVEGDGQHGVKTFDYQHCENLWMPEVKPVKSILKKQSELHSDHSFQVSASEETCLFEQNAGIPFLSLDSQRTSAFSSNKPVYSTLESEPQKSLTAAGSMQISLTHVEDPELQRKKKQLDELSESIARKRAIIALEQKSRDIQDVLTMKREFEMDPDSEEQHFVLPKKNLWSSDIKPNVQPKKSILKKRTELLSFQSDSASIDDYDQVKPSLDDSLYTKPSFQSTATPPFAKSSNPQSVRSDPLGLFNKIIKESQPSLFNKHAIIPKSLAQASNLRSLHEQKPLGKATSSPEGQHRVIMSQPPSETPSTSRTLPSDPKRNVTTQMERFLSALNKADSSIVSSLIQEARRDLPLVSKQKPPQPHLDRNIPFMDEIYDPFQEDDDDNDELSPAVREAGRHSIQKLGKSPMEKEDPNQDDLLPHERAVQDGSGFSQLVGTKYGVDPTAKAEKKLPHGHQMNPDNWSTQEANPAWFSEQRKAYPKDNLYLAEQNAYGDNPDQAAEYQSISLNVQRSYVKDREMPDSTFDKSVARQQPEESNEDKKEDHFEKIQSLLQTIGFHLDTGEISNLKDRTRERLYGKVVKPHSVPTFDRNREPSVSRSEREGSSRADSSDHEGFRSVSPAQFSNRKVYMSYKDSVKNREQQKVEDVDLTSIKRTILNVKPDDMQDLVTPSAEQATVSASSYQPVQVLPAAEAAVSQYAQNANVPAYPPSQYSYYSTEQNPWSSAYSQYPAYGTYGAMPPPPFASFHQAAPLHMMPGYSSYAPQAVNPYPFAAPMAPSHNIVISPVETKKTQPQVRCLKTIETVNMDPATDVKPATDAKPATDMNGPPNQHPMKTRSKAEVYDAVKTQVTTITEEQKKRLEQFNQRMKLKKEKQMEAQRSRGQKQNSNPGKCTPSEIKNVWICGHSLVFWAEKRANSLEFGGQLGMHPNNARIWWKGMQGMTWKQLLPLLLQLKDNWPKPDVIIVHLGGNDISTTPPDVFINYVRKDFTSLKSIFPGCLLVWSDILSRQFWRDTEDSRERDIIRMDINDFIHYNMTKLGGTFLTHNNISPSSGLYRPDGVHLSGKGIDTFNLNLQEFLEKWETEIDMKASDSSVRATT